MTMKFEVGDLLLVAIRRGNPYTTPVKLLVIGDTGTLGVDGEEFGTKVIRPSRVYYNVSEAIRELSKL